MSTAVKDAIESFLMVVATKMGAEKHSFLPASLVCDKATNDSERNKLVAGTFTGLFALVAKHVRDAPAADSPEMARLVTEALKNNGIARGVHKSGQYDYFNESGERVHTTVGAGSKSIPAPYLEVRLLDPASGRDDGKLNSSWSLHNDAHSDMISESTLQELKEVCVRLLRCQGRWLRVGRVRSRLAFLFVGPVAN